MISGALSSIGMAHKALVRMPDALADQLKDRAKVQGVSFNHLVVALLAGAIGFDLQEASGA